MILAMDLAFEGIFVCRLALAFVGFSLLGKLLLLWFGCVV